MPFILPLSLSCTLNDWWAAAHTNSAPLRTLPAHWSLNITLWGRIKLGEYLFLRYGIAIVIVARFVPVLRSVIGILAGANRMLAPPFLFANVVGALVWTSVVGYLSFLFGNLIHQVGHWIAIVVGVVAVTAIVVGVNFLRRHEERLIAEAELALPGRLKSP
jgi:membrane protein DedA with SNARE-associated domain